MTSGGDLIKKFIKFGRKQGAVGMTIGFIVGVAAGTLVKALVTDLINPHHRRRSGQGSLDTPTFKIGDTVFNYGHFIGVLINFILILAVVYVIFKVLGLEKLDIKEEED